MSCKPRQLNKFISLISVSLGGLVSFGSICVYRGDETFYSKVLMPTVSRILDPELAHEACILLTKHKLIRCQSNLNQDQSSRLRTKVFNLDFSNPIGIAAGFDKNSHAAPGLSHYGLGFAEIGTVTPKPQDGNPRKRIFRVLKDKALINRCGFNNKGIDYVVSNLSGHDSMGSMLLGLNLGKNKDTQDLSSDYLVGLEKSHKLNCIDYYVVNISSPNTPGLRDSQDKKNLDRLLEDIIVKMDSLSIRKPLLIKIAPDISESQIKDIADAITKRSSGDYKISGIILTNTTISRPNIPDRDKVYDESGGLSGQPLKDMSTKVIGKFYELTKGKVPIIGVGGVASGQDAYEKIKAGASLIQLYTGVTYEGPPIVNKIKRELADLLKQDNIDSVSEAVGLNHRASKK